MIRTRFHGRGGQGMKTVSRILGAAAFHAGLCVQEQMAELEATINAVPCDTVILGTSVDLRHILDLRHPAVRVRYDAQEIGHPTLAEAPLTPLVKNTSRITLGRAGFG